MVVFYGTYYVSARFWVICEVGVEFGGRAVGTCSFTAGIKEASRVPNGYLCRAWWDLFPMILLRLGERG